MYCTLRGKAHTLDAALVRLHGRSILGVLVHRGRLIALVVGLEVLQELLLLVQCC